MNHFNAPDVSNTRRRLTASILDQACNQLLQVVRHRLLCRLAGSPLFPFSANDTAHHMSPLAETGRA